MSSVVAFRRRVSFIFWLFCAGPQAQHTLPCARVQLSVFLPLHPTFIVPQALCSLG